MANVHLTEAVSSNHPTAGDLCPNCHDGEICISTHRFDEDGGLPDCSILYCLACDFETSPE